MLLQATLNGPYTKDSHPAIPVSPRELADDARTCVAEGARAIHVHPRDMYGAERLDPAVIDHVVSIVKDACGMPVGVSTAAWVEPDLDRRIEMIRRWHAPDYAAVDLAEPGATRIMEACLEAGVGIEAGLCSVEDVETLAASGLGPLVLRIMIEPVHVPAPEAVPLVEAIHAALDRYDLRAPRLQHGDGAAAWILLADALRRGIDTRIGLEDTLRDPDGTLTESNASLVRAVVHSAS
jgi:uncharacterized protein (DUF849 family)